MLLAILIVLRTGAAAALGFALVQRWARGPLLLDSGRGRGMIQVVGTSFAVLLAFVILAAFQTYTGARSAAGSEATAVLDIARTAALSRQLNATSYAAISSATDGPS